MAFCMIYLLYQLQKVIFYDGKTKQTNPDSLFTFSKLTRQSLKGIRVKTKEELVERIYKYFDEVNEEPVTYHWKYKLEEIDSGEA